MSLRDSLLSHGPFTDADRAESTGLGPDGYTALLAGLPDGDYPHNLDKTKFYRVAVGNVYEQNCPDCPVDPLACPTGRLVYVADEDRAVFANDADGNYVLAL